MRGRVPYVALLVAAVAGLVGSAAWAATRSGGHETWPRAMRASACAPTSLPGRVVRVRLMGMGNGGGMMGGDDMMGGAGGMLRLLADRASVPSGRVSFTAENLGNATHELVVLPLSAGQSAGQRVVGTGDRVDEAGSLGEASRSCGAGAGDGIRAGAAGWVTLDLKPGRYELVCNLKGHYRAGMYAELDVE